MFTDVARDVRKQASSLNMRGREPGFEEDVRPTSMILKTFSICARL